ncbi:MAG TPA: hypothetical protein PLV25_07545, partial [Opitutales bacterium]|nr:hypothetical protein [Opitutales bacterium]
MNIPPNSSSKRKLDYTSDDDADKAVAKRRRTGNAEDTAVPLEERPVSASARPTSQMTPTAQSNTSTSTTQTTQLTQREAQAESQESETTNPAEVLPREVVDHILSMADTGSVSNYARTSRASFRAVSHETDISPSASILSGHIDRVQNADRQTQIRELETIVEQIGAGDIKLTPQGLTKLISLGFDPKKTFIPNFKHLTPEKKSSEPILIHIMRSSLYSDQEKKDLIRVLVVPRSPQEPPLILLNSTSIRDKNTILHLASLYGACGIVELLIECGADVNALN